MKTIALIPLFLPLFLTACATERIVEKPVPVYIDRVEYVPVPADLTETRQKQAIPDGLTYAGALELWAKDRETIDVLNGTLMGISSLGGEDDAE